MRIANKPFGAHWRRRRYRRRRRRAARSRGGALRLLRKLQCLLLRRPSTTACGAPSLHDALQKLDLLLEQLVLGREDRILLRNAFADCGISIYCGLAAIWLAERDDVRYWEADFYNPRTARARHWLTQVSGRFIDLFGELRLVGRFSNGEAIFERSRSTCDSGS